VINARVAGDGCATLQGGTKGSAPHHLSARSRPNLPSYESLYGLSRTGLRKRLAGGECRPLQNSSLPLWEFIGGSSSRATVEGARRSPCEPEACTIRPPGSSCGPSSSLQAGGGSERGSSGMSAASARASRSSSDEIRSTLRVRSSALVFLCLVVKRAMQRRGLTLTRPP
jgi:hypothetical protein